MAQVQAWMGAVLDRSAGCLMWFSSGPGINSGAYPKEVTEVPRDEFGRPVQFSSTECPPRPEDKDQDKTGDKK